MEQATKRHIKIKLINASSNVQPVREELDSLLGLVYEKSPLWANRIRDVSLPEYKKVIEAQPSEKVKNGASLRAYQHVCDIDYLRHYITLISLKVQRSHHPT